MIRARRHCPCLALLLVLATACASTRDSIEDPANPAAALGLSGVAPRFVPLFQAVSGAVEARDDETARAVLERLTLLIDYELENFDPGQNQADEERRGLRAAERMAGAFERILEGRAVVADLDLALVSRPVTDDTGAEVDGIVLLSLRATTRGEWPVQLEPSAAILREHRFAISPLGIESHDVRSRGVGRLGEVWIEPEGATVVPLGHAELSLPAGSLAGRTRWTLELRSGDVRTRARILPAMDVTVAADERRYLAGYLPAEAVEPAELVRYLREADLLRAGPERVLPALLERTVRIPIERQEETLDALEPIVLAATQEQLERMVPVLRWLSPTWGPGRDPLAWKRWMRRRGQGLTDLPESFPALDIPTRPR